MYRKALACTLPLVLCLLLVAAAGPVSASSAHKAKEKAKTAIVIASFGTTVPRAVTAITNITDRVKKAFPDTEVRITFTSNIIRKVWRKRQAEPQKWLDQGIPEEILYVKNIISTLGDLREDGYRNIIVQPTHMYYMEQSHDLESYIRAIGSIRTMKKRWQPFDKIVMGRPALGMPGNLYDFQEDVETAVKTFAGDAELAAREDAILLYMGHGNEYWPTGIYNVTQKAMRTAYPDVTTYIGVVEGSPAIEDILSHLSHKGKKKIILKPFMIVAGDHAVNDMAGAEDDSWKSILASEGYTVMPILQGLGSNNQFADIFIEHIKDAARDHHIKLQ